MTRSRFDELTEQFDHLPAGEACAMAWVSPGPPSKAGAWHPRAKLDVAFLLPLLARALDRLVDELDVHPVQWELWTPPEPPALPTRYHWTPRGHIR